MTSPHIFGLQFFFLTSTLILHTQCLSSHSDHTFNKSTLRYQFRHGKKNFEPCVADSECAGARFCAAYIKQKIEPCKALKHCFCLPKNAQMLDCTMYNKCDEGEHCFLGRCISDNAPISQNHATASDKRNASASPKPTPKRGHSDSHGGKGKGKQGNNSTNTGSLLTGEECKKSTECKHPRECVHAHSGKKCSGEGCVCVNLNAKPCGNNTDCPSGENCQSGEPLGFPKGLLCISKRASEESESEGCIAIHHLERFNPADLAYETDKLTSVFCDVWNNCATPGHMVLYKDSVMMMKSYCATVHCERRLMKVNSPKYVRHLIVPSHWDQLKFTALAARFETIAEEKILQTAYRMGL